MTRRLIPCITLSLSLALLAGCGSGGKAKATEGPRGGRKLPVEVTTVKAREVSYRIASVGSLEAADVISITARVAGVAEKVSFREGDVVTPDRVLVEIEPERFRLAVAQARANLERAEATSREAEAALRKREELHAKDPGWVSDEELMTLRSRLDVTRAEVAQAKAALELAELSERDAFVRAAAAGEIQRRSVQPGQYVSPGSVLATLVRANPLFLRFQVSEREAIRVQPGMEVEIQARADPTVTHRAILTHVADAADPKTRRVECLARVVSESASLRPGFFAEVAIRTGARDIVPVIPEGAIKPTEKGFVVYVVLEGKAVERIVQTGLRTEDGGIEIREGVKPGETLVTRGAQYLRSGAEVEVKP